MRILSILLIVFLGFGCSNSSNKHIESTIKGNILFVVSNQHTYGTSRINTANHFAEIVLAYNVLTSNLYEVDFVSPDGGAIPIGYLNTSDSIQKYYLYNSDFMSKLKHTKSPGQVNPENYLAIYYGGGGAAMFGVPENQAIQKIATSIYNNNGIVSAICHGTAGIVNLKNEDGSYLYEGKRVNGFPDMFEAKDREYYKTFPFSIEETILERGGLFSYSDKGWDNFYLVDGRLITGQDPTAATSIANAIIKTLESNK